MPPTIGAAIRYHTSDQVPVAHMIGINPTNIVATVMSFGRNRFAAPSTITASEANGADIHQRGATWRLLHLRGAFNSQKILRRCLRVFSPRNIALDDQER